ncbi:MAG TPA: hypothetical protein PLP30_11375 [Clostridia bacterium]|nr:hypothetical protein [Clostridia bacterium]HPQ47963.1 hypothetical protein [Clostridia bacterium]
MNELKPIKVKPKTGNECITANGFETGYKLIDFWKWSISDIVENATRERFAEFIVGTAVGISPDQLRVEWDAWDITTDSGIKIEVKSSAYIQSWGQRKFSKISFSIKPTTNSDSDTTPKRHADLYVFCHLKHTDQETMNPLEMDQWDFYVLPTCKLDYFSKNQLTISLNSLRELASQVNYNRLKDEISDAYNEQKCHEEEVNGNLSL